MSTLLACQRDSYQVAGVSTVLRCDEVEAGKEYALTLSDSVLYPEGGGQPCDLGTCGGQEVLHVGGSECSEGVRVVVRAPVEAGTQVECNVDWERRFDLMQQHTCQHLFSAVMWEMYEADTVKWELGSKTVAVDFDFSRSLALENLRNIEQRVNMYIRENRLVSFDTLRKEDLSKVPFLRGAPKGAAANFEELRIVTIEGLDANPCGGTHVRSTAEIQMFSIVGSEVDRGSLRLRFLSGTRLLGSLHCSLDREHKLSALLSVPPQDHSKIVEALLQDKKSAAKAMKAREDELSVLFAAHIVQKWQESSASINSNGGTVTPAIALHRPGASLSFLQTAADCVLDLSATYKLGIQVIYMSSAEIIATSASAKASTKKLKGRSVDMSKYYNSSLMNNIKSIVPPNDNTLSGVFVLHGVPAVVAMMKEPIFSIIEGRGGGRPGKLQGNATKVHLLQEIECFMQSYDFP